MKTILTLLLITLWLVSFSQNESEFIQGKIARGETITKDELNSLPAREIAYASAIRSCWVTFGKKAFIHGIITDVSTSEPLAFANITLIKDDSVIRGTTSAINGIYNIEISEGIHTLRVQYVGYPAFEKTLSLNDSAVKLDVKLKSGIKLQCVEVIAFKNPLVISCPIGSYTEESPKEEILVIYCGGHFGKLQYVLPDDPVMVAQEAPFSLTKLFPNPFTTQFQINIEASQAVRARIMLYNLSGQLTYQDELMLSAGDNQYFFTKGNVMQSGIYILEINGEGHREALRVLKINESGNKNMVGSLMGNTYGDF